MIINIDSDCKLLLSADDSIWIGLNESWSKRLKAETTQGRNNSPSKADPYC